MRPVVKGLGRVKTKSNLVVALSGGGILAFFCFERDHKPQNSGCFFALSVTTSLKIPGAVIPRRVFTRPGPSADPALERQGRRLSGDLYRASGGTGDIADLSRRLRPSQGWSSSRLVGSGATSLRRLAEALNARTS